MISIEQRTQQAVTQGEQMIRHFERILDNSFLPDSLITSTRVLISLVAIALISYVTKLVVDYIILKIINRIALHTKSLWDDCLVERRVFKRLSNLIPVIIAYKLINIALTDFDSVYFEVAHTLLKGYSVFIIMWSLDAFLSAANDIYQTTEFSKDRSIKGYIQLGKILIYFTGSIVIISILIGKNPATLFLGLGTFAAVLMLVFKDTILGLVASIQISANDLVKIGDWIEMPNRKIDGKVLEINLTAVKVQNWDFSINTIPTYAMVSESFQNWRGMELAGGRRFRNSIYVDVNTVRLCSDDLLNNLYKFPILRPYLDEIKERIEKNEESEQNSQNDIIMGIRPSNLNLFRTYIELSLRNHPDINQEMAILVRYQLTLDNGAPVEYMCFSIKKVANEFEEVKSRILEHLWSVLPEFRLAPFQQPTGNDFRALFERRESEQPQP